MSQLDFGGTLAWAFHWSETFATFLRVSGTRVSLSQPASISLYGADSTLIGSWIGATWALTRELDLSIFAGGEQEPLLRAYGLGNLAVDVPWLPQGGVDLRYAFIEPHPVGAGIEGKAVFNVPFSANGYTTTWGPSWVARAFIETAFKSTGVEAGASYSSSMVGSSITDETTSELGFGLKLKWELGK